MSNISLSHLAFDRGIDRVTYTRQQEATQLPEREEALPPDLGGRAQLDALLSRPTLDDALDAAVRPLLENRDLLMPSRFGQALQSALIGGVRRLDADRRHVSLVASQHHAWNQIRHVPQHLVLTVW